MTRINVKNLKGNDYQYVLVREDREGTDHVFLSAPTLALLTPEQAMSLANALVDVAEKLEQR